MTVCNRWNSRLTFIGQLYCPIDNKEETFHRMLYIYACLKGKCLQSSEAVRIFRCQLSQSNKYFSERPPNYSLLELSDAALSDSQKDVLDAINSSEFEYQTALKVQEQSKKLSSVYLLGIEDEQTKLTRKLYKKLVVLEGGEEDLDDYDSDDSCVMSQTDKEIMEKHWFDQEDANLGTTIIYRLKIHVLYLDEDEKKHAKELLTKYMENESAEDPNFEKTKKLLENPDEEEEEDLDELVDELDKKKAISKEFNIFLEATKLNPSQVIRHCQKGMLPLWSSK